jgi:class 3 adenylate cyclase
MGDRLMVEFGSANQQTDIGAAIPARKPRQ